MIQVILIEQQVNKLLIKDGFSLCSKLSKLCNFCDFYFSNTFLLHSKVHFGHQRQIKKMRTLNAITACKLEIDVQSKKKSVDIRDIYCFLLHSTYRLLRTAML